MKNTGEQFIPGISSERLAHEHDARYVFAEGFVKDAVVLDIACGTGYGSNLLARTAHSVIGADISLESIEFASSHYRANNLSFKRADATDENLCAPKSLDVVVSFETIEHLDALQRSKFLSNIKKWLKPGGTLIMSTPNKSVTSPYSDKPLNQHHVLEFTLKSLQKEVSPFLTIQETYGQRLIPKFITYPVVRRSIRVLEKILHRDFRLYDLSGSPEVRPFDPAWREPRIQVIVAVNDRT